MLAKYCFECHNAKALKGGLSLETYKEMVEGAEKGPVFEAGKADQSLLVTSLEGRTKPAMPPKAAKSRPTTGEVALIRAWVSAGAKDDSSLIKVVIPTIKPRPGAVAPVTSVVYDPAGRWLAIAKHKLLEIVDLKTGVGQRFPQAAHITALAFSADGASLAIALGDPGSANGVIIRAINQVPAKTETFPDLHNDAILDIAFSPDGALLVSAGYDMKIKLTPLTPAAQPFAHTLKEHSDAVYAAAFSPDGTRLASCSANRAVKVWDAATGKLLYTLGDSTDWLYTLAWSPDGKQLASGGVDKSIRVYAVRHGCQNLAFNFRARAPVQKLVYARDGKTLYSLGQDRVLKAWDAARMVETKTFDRLPETGLCLAARPGELAVGRYDGVTQIFDAAKGTSKPLSVIVDPFPTLVASAGANGSPGTGQLVTLPVSVVGKLAKAGDVAYFRFRVTKGQQLGVQLLTKEIKSKIEPNLQLTDEHGKVLAVTTKGILGYTFSVAGVYAVGVRDQEFRGGADMDYRLHLGPIPIVTSLFPLGLEHGTQTDIAVNGVFLSANKVHVEAPAKKEPGSRLPVSVASSLGKPLGMAELVIGEFPEVTAPAKDLPIPGTANGQLLVSGQADLWRITARKGQRLILETEARRLGSASIPSWKCSTLRASRCRAFCSAARRRRMSPFATMIRRRQISASNPGASSASTTCCMSAAT